MDTILNLPHQSIEWAWHQTGEETLYSAATKITHGGTIQLTVNVFFPNGATVPYYKHNWGCYDNCSDQGIYPGT